MGDKGKCLFSVCIRDVRCLYVEAHARGWVSRG